MISIGRREPHHDGSALQRARLTGGTLALRTRADLDSAIEDDLKSVDGLRKSAARGAYDGMIIV